MSLKGYQKDIYTGTIHRIGTKRHSNYREKLEKDLKKFTLEEIKKKVEMKKKKDIDCIIPCKEDEVCNRKSGKCVKKTSKYGIGILRKEDEIFRKEYRIEDWDRIKMPMDNHCGYHGFLYALKVLLKKEIELDLNQSTKELILELKYILLRNYQEKKIDNHFHRIFNNSNNWLEDIDLQVLANHFNIIIYVYDDRMRDYKNDIFTEISPTPKRGDLEKIFLFQTINHYDVIIPKTFQRNLDIEIPKSTIISDNDLKSFLMKKGLLPQENYIEESLSPDEKNDFSEDELIPSIEEETIIPSKSIYKKDIISRESLSNDEIRKILKEKLDSRKIDKLKKFSM